VAPVLRDQANFLIMADLSAAGIDDGLEQLWAKQVGPTQFVLCCIPFFTYGLALGDVVETEAARGKQYVVRRVVNSAGHRVLRIWLARASQPERQDILAQVVSHGFLHEWSSDNLLAIDVPPGCEMEDFLKFLSDETMRANIDVEWGDS